MMVERLFPPDDRWYMMSLAFCPREVSQVPQHFRCSETQATCDDCFARQIHSLGMVRKIAHLQAKPLDCYKNYFLVILFFFLHGYMHVRAEVCVCVCVCV